MTSFADLKRSSSTSFEQLNRELLKLNQKNERSSTEDLYWKPTQDKAGNGYAVIRFLPAPQNETVPFVRLWDHGFQGPGGWYIENCRSTLNEPDPVMELNSKLWNTGLESDKETARKQKRRLSYHSNIYVVSDSAAPENEGKVFLFKYGKKIFDKLNDVMNPSFEDEKPLNPFDLWEGADFKLKIRKVEGWTNYDKSEFDSPKPLFQNDEKLEEVWKNEHSLSQIVDPKNFKSYEILKAKLDKVLTEPGSAAAASPRQESAPIREAAQPSAPAKEEPQGSADSDDEDFMALFKNFED